MAIAILIFTAVCVAHFVYEGIIAPSLRLQHRFKLFELRDDLRAVKADYPEECSDETFEALQGILNTGLRMLPRTDLVLMASYEAERAKNPEFCKSLERRQRALDACSLPSVTRIVEETHKVASYAFLTNSGGWMLSLFPIFIATVMWHRVQHTIQRLLLVPPQEHLEESGYFAGPDGAVIAA